MNSKLLMKIVVPVANVKNVVAVVLRVNAVNVVKK
jgi:hypothetical protein